MFTYGVNKVVVIIVMSKRKKFNHRHVRTNINGNNRIDVKFSDAHVTHVF